MYRELAELLGPAKPPTATESEIEKSGLEIFKAKLISEFEKAGRVSNNCVDRVWFSRFYVLQALTIFSQCLICLDDYEEEDDCRLLSCKHAFHRTCVDHWLKTGRNNCPACRSTVSSMHLSHGRSDVVSQYPRVSRLVKKCRAVQVQHPLHRNYYHTSVNRCRHASIRFSFWSCISCFLPALYLPFQTSVTSPCCS